jgi:hypothetical protein
MAYDPVKTDSEPKKISMNEFVAQFKKDLDRYAKEMDGANEFHRSKHPFDEWMKAFGSYMSV